MAVQRSQGEGVIAVVRLALSAQLTIEKIYTKFTSIALWLQTKLQANHNKQAWRFERVRV